MASRLSARLCRKGHYWGAVHMRRKTLLGFDYTDNELAKLAMYLFVGGTAALFEWILFCLLFRYVTDGFTLSLTARSLAATTVAFGISTVYHYILGNILVFDSGSRYGRGREFSLVVLVSVMGLGFNLVLMYVFVTLLGWIPLLSKMLASAIVVAWNYLSRRRWIFKG